MTDTPTAEPTDREEALRLARIILDPPEPTLRDHLTQNYVMPDPEHEKLARALLDCESELNLAERSAEDLAKERSAAVDAANHWKWRYEAAERERGEWEKANEAARRGAIRLRDDLATAREALVRIGESDHADYWIRHEIRRALSSQEAGE